MHRIVAAALLLLAPLALAACSDAAPAAGGGDATAAASPAADTGPTAADRDYAEITANWSPATFEGCGRVLQETLGTRDLVQGALDGVNDTAGKAAAEIDDARYWLGLGNDKIAGVRQRLQDGECDGDITLALDEAVQFFVKAGTSAVQAGQIAAS